MSYVPAEAMTEDQLQKEIEKCRDHWNDIYQHGCSDPFYEDGVNLNLVRNHIIYYGRYLEEKAANVQLSLFCDLRTVKVPPKVPDTYMAKNGRFPDRLKGRRPRV